jgi:hypothetical protein
MSVRRRFWNAARARLSNAADRLAKELLRMATDDNVSDSVKLAAIRDALDRGGLSVKQEVELTARSYQQIFEGMSVETGSRADYRRSQGIESEPELIPSDARAALAASDGTDSDALDVEIIEDDGQPITPDDDERGSVFDSEAQPSPFATPQPPGTALMTLEDAVAVQAQMRRSVVSHRATRR